MGMLGNSVRGLEPDQKQLLYRSCVMLVITYGFHLWYFKGTHIKGLIKAMSQVQHTAMRWICGTFHTTPGGGAECLSGLLPMHLTLRCLADRGTTCVPMLAKSHPLRTILGEAMEGCHQAHSLALANSRPLSVTSLQGAAVDMAVGVSALWQDEYEPFGPDSQPGNHMVDLFQSHFHRHGPASKKDEDIVKYRDQLDLVWAEAYVDELCCMVVVDASMPTGGVFQAAAAALVYQQGDVVSRVVSAVGRHTPPEVERFVLQLGISAALAKRCQKLVVVSDSLPAVESPFSVELRSGQIFSLDCCRAVGPWLAGDLECFVHLWFVPSRMEWGAQKAAHNVVVSLKIAVGRHPWTSRDFLRQCADVEASKDWCELFKDPSYHGHSFLDLENSRGKPVQPLTCNGGPWLSESRVGTSTFSRLCHCITGHVPLGVYCQHFNISGDIHCLCRVRHGILETRSHALHSCPHWMHANPLSLLDTVPTLTKFVQSNAAFCAIVHSQLVWDPG
jgi:hypothetical protein